jgi:hypothetical protein
MRFLTAVLLFAASIVLVILGIGQRTVWAGPASHEVRLKVVEDKPFFLIPNAALTKFEGRPTVTVKGNGNLFVASGRESDIDSWLGSESNSIITFGGPKNEAVIEARPGQKTVLSPVGSDLWRQEIKGATKIQLEAVNPADENALLLARDGSENAPGDISLEWPVSRDFTFSTYLIVAGAALLVAAFFINSVSLLKLRSQSRPRRKMPKAPHGPRSRPKRGRTYSAPRGRRALKRLALGLPAAALTVSLLSGCSISTAIDPSPTPTESLGDSQPPASLLVSQINRILTDTAAVASLADSGKDRTAISNRFAGPALEVRNVNYLLQSRQKSVPGLPTISANAKIALPVAAKEWPRTLMAVTRDATAGSAPQMLVFQQDSPRTNYKVWYSIELHLKTPKVAATETGAVPTPADSGFLVMKPQDIVTNYGDLINNPYTSLAINDFDVTNDDFYHGIVKIQATNSASLKKGTIVFNHVLANDNILGLNTASSGALVALYMNDVTVTKPKKATQAIVVSGLEKVLLGSAGSLKGISTTYGDMMLFFVPNTGGGRIQLLGYTSGLIKVKGL